MYIVKTKNIRGYIAESEIYSSYKDALTYALECKDSGQYSVITILKEGEGVNIGKFFLHRIIKWVVLATK